MLSYHIESKLFNFYENKHERLVEVNSHCSITMDRKYGAPSNIEMELTYLQTGQLHDSFREFIVRKFSKSKHWMCLQSLPLAGSLMACWVMGHFKETVIAVCSIASSDTPPGPIPFAAKLRFILAALSSLFSRFCLLIPGY